MNNQSREPDYELEERLSRRLLDIFIRAGLVLALVLLCYQIFSPFMTMMLWALILAITIYPLHQMLAAHIGGKQGLASNADRAARHRRDLYADGHARQSIRRLSP